MKNPKFELLNEEEKKDVVVKEYVLSHPKESLVIVYTELLTDHGSVIDTFMTDKCGNALSEEEFPGLLREVQEFLFPEEFGVK